MDTNGRTQFGPLARDPRPLGDQIEGHFHGVMISFGLRHAKQVHAVGLCRFRHLLVALIQVSSLRFLTILPTPWLPAALVLVGAVFPSFGAVSVGFDVETLNELLPALSANAIEVPITEKRSVQVFLDSLKITGLDPASDETGSGHILTSMQVRIPQLGVKLPLAPRLSLHVVDAGSAAVLELRFEQAEISLPLLGEINIAPFLPPIRFPAENAFLVAGVEGDVEVRSRLSSIVMGQKVVRLEFDLETVGDK